MGSPKDGGAARRGEPFRLQAEAIFNARGQRIAVLHVQECEHDLPVTYTLSADVADSLAVQLQYAARKLRSN